MITSDRPEFDVQLNLFCAGFNVPPGDRSEAYWKGLAKMSLTEFTRCIEYSLSEDGPERIPTVHQIWEIRRKLRSRGGRDRLLTPASEDRPFNGDKWDIASNHHLLDHIKKTMSANPTKYGDPRTISPAMEAATAILVAYKKAWATDMREWGSEPTREDQQREWHADMKAAEAEIGALSQQAAA